MGHFTQRNGGRLSVAMTVGLLFLALAGCKKDAPPPPERLPATSEPPAAETMGARVPTTTERPPKDNIFVWVEGGAEYLDPNKISESAGTNTAQNMFEGLLAHAPGNAPPVPGVAKSYDKSADATVYTFHLRDNAKWSNGRQVTAQDFVYSWRRGLEPETASRNAQQLWFIKGAKEYNSGELKDFSKVGVRAVDDLTLEVELVSPTPFFPYVVAYIAYAPVPKEAVEAWGPKWTQPEHIITNGAFHMTEWKLRARIVLKKSPTYWDADNVRFAGAINLHNESEDNAFQLFEAGKVHYTPGQVPAQKIPVLMSSGRSDYHLDPYMCVYYYVFRTDRPPFDDVRIRHAINLATDKERITKHILRAGQRPATHLVPPMFRDTLGYTSPEGEDFDPEAAARLLAEAGYPGGKGLPKIEMIYNTYEGNRLIAESIQRNLKDGLGIEPAANNMEWKSLLKLMQSGEFQLARASWCADYPDPVNFLEVLHSEGESNYAGYKNPEYDALLDAIRKTPDQAKRNELMAKAESVVNRDVPLLPLYFYTRSYMLKPYVKGFEPQFMDNHLLKYMYFQE